MQPTPEQEAFQWQVGVWDRISQLYFREIDPRFASVVAGTIRRADLRPGERVLDLGTGTAALAVEAARLIRTSGTVTGLDISPDMLSLAKRRVDASTHTNIELRQGRAEEIPAGDAAYDVVLASLSLMYVIDRSVTAREVRRVLRPSGRFVGAVWAAPERCDIVRFQQTAGKFAPPPPLLLGYRVRVLDGNHLAGTEHRLGELRRYRAAALPGHTLVLYDPQWDLATEVIPCEDAHAQERSLLPEALAKVAARDCIVADRNFCTTGFLFGLARRGAFFVIRQHVATLVWQLQGERRYIGQDERGQALYEQAISLTEADTGTTLVARRITVELCTPTRQGETELHILTNLPSEDAPAGQVAALYADRWTIETAFHHLTVELHCEVDTLGYPKAALFGFCVAVVAYNVVALVKGALRAAHGAEYVDEQLSMYYLTLEVAQVATGMEIALGAEPWEIFRRMSAVEFAATLVEVAECLDTKKYTKHKRSPKKPPPKKISGKRHPHVSTARILALRA